MKNFTFPRAPVAYLAPDLTTPGAYICPGSFGADVFLNPDRDPRRDKLLLRPEADGLRTLDDELLPEADFLRTPVEWSSWKSLLQLPYGGSMFIAKRVATNCLHFTLEQLPLLLLQLEELLFATSFFGCRI
jgi:hypothetical protein